MPVARSMVTHSAILTGPGVDGGNASVGAGTGAGGAGGTPMDTGDGADDGGEADDGRLYCWCQVGSYGDMVACDDNECEREWVSLLLSLTLKLPIRLPFSFILVGGFALVRGRVITC
jgi:inhibitor of growth protein 3